MSELGDTVRAWARAQRLRMGDRANRTEAELKEIRAPLIDQPAFAVRLVEVMRSDSAWAEVTEDEALDAVRYISSRLGLILWLPISPVPIRISLVKEIPHLFTAILATKDLATQQVVREFWDGVLLRGQKERDKDQEMVMQEVLTVVDSLLLEQEQPWQMSAIDALNIIRDAPAVERLKRVATTSNVPDGVRAYAKSVLEDC